MANPEYIDKARTRSKALVGNLAGKHVAGSLGGVVATLAVHNAMRFRAWGDVIGSGAVSIGGGIAVKHLMRTAKGRNTMRQRWRSYRINLGDDEFDGMDNIGINDFGIDHFNEDGVLGDEDDLLGDFMRDADEMLDFGDIADLGEEVIET